MRMFIRTIKLTGVTLAAAFAFGSGVAQADPQTLALVATDGKVNLTCQGEQCTAEFSSFCLQADRYSPSRGTKYVLAEGNAVRLVGTTKDGREVTLDSGAFLKFESLRTHVATRISVSRAQLDRLGVRTVAVVVGEGISLLPLPGQGIGDVTSDQDRELLTGPLRILGTKIVDSDSDRMVAARITNRVINSLPETGRIGAERGKALWRQVVDDAGNNGAPAHARKLAENAFDLCSFLVHESGSGTMRECLQSHHDKLINALNSDYWKAVNTGS